MADQTRAGARAVAPDDEPSRRRRRLSPLTVIGVLLMAFGLAAVGWMGWQYFGTNVTSTRQITTVKKQLHEQWAASSQPAGKVNPGDGIALIRIPALDRPGEPYEQPVIVGVRDDDLARGIGWYTETSRPGQIGNFAIAGHRITHGEPFARLMELKVDDLVIVETADATYTYKLFKAPKDLTVKDTENWVLDPDPTNPGRPATKATLTLTTCTDLFASPQRSVGFATLVDSKRKAA